MDDQTQFSPLTQALSAHCMEAGIQGPAIDVHQNQDASKTLVLTVSAEARWCFESLFYRVFLRRPARGLAGYLICQDEARQLVEREPYYDPCPHALTSPERIDAEPPS
jgi:hypothetical protein